MPWCDLRGQFMWSQSSHIAVADPRNLIKCSLRLLPQTDESEILGLRPRNLFLTNIPGVLDTCWNLRTHVWNHIDLYIFKVTPSDNFLKYRWIHGVVRICVLLNTKKRRLLETDKNDFFPWIMFIPFMFQRQNSNDYSKEWKN